MACAGMRLRCELAAWGPGSCYGSYSWHGIRQCYQLLHPYCYPAAAYHLTVGYAVTLADEAKHLCHDDAR